ncbi:MAG: excinuclease ABC subunit UvrA [Theionarchaea archaeon]|nr:excinuclease ABC subunit UvrA [Theionarchaea archaeon]
MVTDRIYIKGASQHNLKNIDVEIPRNKLVVITGVSGSGKSSLAFDTIYAEGQRRYVESLSAYARQFLEQMDKPDVEYIEGLSPAISIEQKGVSKNPRSTVGTVTEIYDYLRLLFARIGVPHCPQCGREIQKQSAQEIVDQVLEFEEEIKILAPIVRGRKGIYKKELENLLAQGFINVRIDGEIKHLDEEEVELEKFKKHDIEVVVDTVTVTKDLRERITDSIEMALDLSDGLVIISGNVDQESEIEKDESKDIDREKEKEKEKEKDRIYSEHFSCPECGVSFEELEPRMFSFNSPFGACPECHGLGERKRLDPDLILDMKKSLLQGAIRPWKSKNQDGYYMSKLTQVARHYNIPLDKPLKDLPQKFVDIILNGTRDPIHFIFEGDRSRWEYTGGFEGILSNLKRRYSQTRSEYIRSEIETFMSSIHCPVCNGKRLKPESLAVTIQGKCIIDVTEMSVRDAQIFFEELNLSEKEQLIAKQILKEIRERLGFMVSVGLEYLTLDRKAGTLSGGEAQRIRLATQIGSSLMGVLYILDEPSIGLHQRDNARLLSTLEQLRDLGNTVIVIEHDEATMRSADHILDMGPGAGVHGGYVVAQGTVQDICENPDSLTGKYLNREMVIPIPDKRLTPKGHLVLKGVRHNNLKNIDVKIPLGTLICITGVSGSGKSSLVDDTLHKALAQHFYGSAEKPGLHDDIEGLDKIDKVIIIDQSPIGRTPRSNPATYTSAFTPIRDLFSQLPESKKRGYKPGRFSFNVKGGRCEACKGYGLVKIEMHFLPDVYVPCEVCKGKRFNKDTLSIRYKEKNIAEVMDMGVEEALAFFENIPTIKRKLKTLYDVGMGYIKLGQPATTLSGGEAQRVKLTKELSKRGTGNTLYILDEPTTGLHFDDIKKLLKMLKKLVKRGNTVVVIEHNLDVIKTADYIIDLGPEGGEEGGYIVAEGTPEVIAQTDTHTGKFLKKVLEEDQNHLEAVEDSRMPVSA